MVKRITGMTFALAFLSTADMASAQVPKVTNKGDPTVQDDSIYRLAVDPSQRPNDAIAFLLDDGVVKLEADGRHTRTFRSVIQVLKETEVRRYAEQQIGYFYDHEALTINWIRVLKPNGEVISDKPATSQETETAAAMNTPVYIREKVRRMSLTGVAVGTIIDFSYTKEEKKPYRPGDYFFRWTFGYSNTEVKRTRFIFDVPATLQPTILERDMPFKPAMTEKDGRRTYMWATKDLPRFVAEPFAPDSLNDAPSVAISLPTTWADIGKWYNDLAKDRYAVEAAAEVKLKSVVGRNVRTREDTIRAVHRWATQDILYSSIALGMGGYQPRAPNDVVTTLRGDCKDKATLFVASLRKLGIEAYPVLLHSFGAADPKNPSIQQFNHAIAAVKQPAGGYVFTDLTSTFTKYGDLPLSEQGGFAIIVKDDGSVEEVRLPRTSAVTRKAETSIVATLSDSGFMSGSIGEVRTGDGFETTRQLYGMQLDSTRKANLIRASLTRFPGAKGDSLVSFNGMALGSLASYTIYFSRARGSSQAGDADLFTVPIPPYPAMQQVTYLQGLPPRKLPIDASRILAGNTISQEVLITLPAGWKARLPKDVNAVSDFGRYRVSYTQAGQLLRIVRTVEPTEGIYPASRMNEVIGWLTQVGMDENNKTMILERAPKQ